MCHSVTLVVEMVFRSIVEIVSLIIHLTENNWQPFQETCSSSTDGLFAHKIPLPRLRNHHSGASATSSQITFSPHTLSRSPTLSIDSHLHRPIYVCELCGRTFNRKFTHTQHVRTHTGQRPYQCMVCGRAFKQNVQVGGRMGMNERDLKVKRHVRTHRVFTQVLDNTIASTIIHKELNDGTSIAVIQYVCPFCEFTQRTKAELIAHLTDVHDSCKVCDTHTHTHNYRCGAVFLLPVSRPLQPFKNCWRTSVKDTKTRQFMCATYAIWDLLHCNWLGSINKMFTAIIINKVKADKKKYHPKRSVVRFVSAHLLIEQDYKDMLLPHIAHAHIHVMSVRPRLGWT